MNVIAIAANPVEKHEKISIYIHMWYVLLVVGINFGMTKLKQSSCK